MMIIKDFILGEQECKEALKKLDHNINLLLQSIHSLKEKNKELKEELNDKYANDKKIVELTVTVDNLERNLKDSFRVYDSEWEKIREWQTSHNQEKHNSKKSSFGVSGGQWTYLFTPTGIGTIVTVKCTCGDELCVREL